MFTKQFDRYTCDGDTITCTVDGYDCTATIYRDDSSDAPDERQDGFWPSLDPKDAGYIGDKTQAQLTAEKRKASHIMNTWKKDEWWYVGVAVTVSKNGIQLTGDYDHAVWGIECNYPYGGKVRNNYLRDVANEELDEALEAAKLAVKSLCEEVTR
jgi:hypothetical protein